MKQTITIAGQECLINTPEKTALLRFLIDRPLAFYSLDTLMGKSGLDELTITETIAVLQAEGIRINYRPSYGFYYEPRERLLHPDTVTARLSTRWWGKRILVGDEITSTIDLAKTLAGQADSHGTVIAANQQTKGRGRFGAPWISPKGKDLLLTFLAVIPEWELSPSLLSLYAVTAVARVLDTAYQIPVKIKWPNDLMAHKKKLGGVLVERDEQNRRLLISLGLNIHSAPQDWPPDLRATAVSLAMLRPDEWRRDLLLAQCGSTWESLWEAMRYDGGETVRGYWKRYSSTLGKTIRLKVRGREMVAFTKSIDEAGRLVLTGEDGAEFALRPDEAQSIQTLE